MSAAHGEIGGLYAIADDDPRWPRGPVEQARAALAGGARLVQLRVKHATDACSLEWARSITALAHERGALFFMNDRFDLALAAGADGVHLGQRDLPPARLPAAARARLRVGRSTHTLAQARAARTEDVDYIAFGPIFGTASKASAYGERGLAALAAVVLAVAPVPVVAIGGIDGTRAGAVRQAGAAASCVIGALAGVTDPVAAARELTRAIDAATPRADPTVGPA